MKYLGSISNNKDLVNKEYVDNLIAPVYSSSSAYSVGESVLHNNKVYKCNTAIASPGEVWNAEHWTEVKVAKGMADTTLSCAGAAADAKVTGGKIDELKSVSDGTMLAEGFYKNPMVIPDDYKSGGYYDIDIGADTINSISPSSNWATCGIHRINDGDSFLISPVSAKVPRITLYDENGILRAVHRANDTTPILVRASVEGYKIAFAGISIPTLTSTSDLSSGFINLANIENVIGQNNYKWYDKYVFLKNASDFRKLNTKEFYSKFRQWNMVDFRKKVDGRYYNNIIGISNVYSTSPGSWNAYGVYEVENEHTYKLNAIAGKTPAVILYDEDGIAQGYIRNNTAGQDTVIDCSVSEHTIKYISVAVGTPVTDSDIVLYDPSNPYYIADPSGFISKAKTGQYDMPGLYIPDYSELSNDLFAILDGKTVYATGDSITAGAGNSGVSYITMIANDHGMTLTNLAETGATWVKSARTPSQGGGYRAWILDKVDNMIALDSAPDYIILSGGYNDTTGSYDPDTQTVIPNPVGTSEGTGYGGTYDISTVIGCIETAFYRLLNKYKSAKILYVITYKLGPTLQSNYAPAIEACCQKWSIPVVNFCKEGGVNSSTPSWAVLNADNVHPNATGYARMARLVKTKLASI